ncbi:hypothetical protein GCM10011495_24030 [Hymenobacter frigidus]|jgi:hypothetical protein|uniref:DUF4410 domain-containing protein n=1 Tax=Hymenobacter frigidus TaxID=1524095 RepID=A0ABQ2A8U7_9BACT|nr:hypothetical protein [Hymenobacter frigidus]GGH86743.1 hypothetical protein GCM10011495_24030 [Hymenobacter frigidus]
MKHLSLTVLLALFTTLLASAQTREIYTSPKFKLLTKDHKTLAVLPFRTTLQLRPAEVKKNGGIEGVRVLEEREGLGVQSALQSYLLKQKGDNDITVDVQDVARTNALLAKNGMTSEKTLTMTMEELAQMLGVDGVISGTFESSQPMSGGAAVAMLMVGGFSGPTNTGKLVININDGRSGELLWKYDKSLARGFGSDTNSIITTIMRKASRQFPYSKEFKG